MKNNYKDPDVECLIYRFEIAIDKYCESKAMVIEDKMLKQIVRAAIEVAIFNAIKENN